MAIKQIAQPVTDDGIRWTNFFNGRLLSGEDLSREQDAQRLSRRALGQALGSGVATGLEVSKSRDNSPSQPRIHLAAGLALNRRGQTLSLGQDIDLSLIQTDNPASLSSSDFDACTPPQTGLYVAASGAYLLVISPASTREGRAPTSGLGNQVSGCNSQFLVEAVQFRLVPVSLTPDEIADADRLRSYLAHRCFGSLTPIDLTQNNPAQSPAFLAHLDFDGLARDPFGSVADRYGLVDDLRATSLTDCDVPLALIVWTADEGVRFVDTWSARRRVTHPSSSGRFASLIDDRRLSESEAMFLQFEDHLEDLYAGPVDPSSIVADQNFWFLPPAGMVPVLGGPSPRGFDASTFFGDLGTRDLAMIDAASLRPLFQESLAQAPIDLTGSAPIQLYLIWENFNAVQAGAAQQLALVFASTTLPYRGVARFGRAHWNLSRFATTPI